MAKENSKSKSQQIAEKTIFAAFKILKDAGGEMRGKDVVNKIRDTIEFDDYENHRYGKTGYIRWESIMHFYTIDCIKAGFLRKNKGIWILTEEGEKAIKLGSEKLLTTATKLYREWDSNRKKEDISNDIEDFTEENNNQVQKSLLSQYEDEAFNGIRDFVINKNPYEFQFMVAALLKAMDYHISFVADKGKDGGIDIVAYQDPLGIKKPRIKVQVKHYPNTPISPDAIRSLKGLLNPGEEIGLFVTSGSFSNESKRFARESNIHIKLIDGDELIDLWQTNYNKLSDVDKNMLPLYPIYFLGSNE